MTIFISTIFLLLFFLIELLYFKIASHYNIIDKPNFRSSHSNITIRGGGIIFAIGMLIYFVAFGFSYPYFILGLLIISAVSFVDDIKPVSNKLRIICHFFAVLLLFFQTGMLDLPIYLVALSFVIVIGIINAINFMDGINGLTGIYAFVTLITLYYLNNYIDTDFVANDLIIVAILSVIVFLFFNLRIKAKSFAGDVGSVGIAFILVFLIGSLIIMSQNLNYLLLLLLYGLDSITTIVFRLMRKENIFSAHRSHFYQFLANEKNIPHPLVAIGYAIVQLLFNGALIIVKPSYSLAIIYVILVGTLFIMLRFLLEGKKRLLEAVLPDKM
ncbi:UDP-GlcNAc--UDP-phosphate GlcNAc-1-phosphate transferase [Pedobacter chinensis]|uniref:UDP-GlcNAc--UDP-phosphate GlcNAc-1-phosphate transferase n=1 Tax=Pedobacter chinensis TaxID=2282421 RepID=A0A369PPP5_9SPHI|nr:UDP-GlcNAc--UDP-phosphate GlcNAc-1-phosphate transferase [Pedobacter chinensis]RDC54252.1 UDP-GlcNAc--UDP-phosphate GlcNAc-1-phosphate transferase [Pedobacter chinensis]